MSKWYENAKCSDGIIISSRVRLARNLKKYSFYNKLSNADAEKMINEVKEFNNWKQNGFRRTV